MVSTVVTSSVFTSTSNPNGHYMYSQWSLCVPPVQHSAILRSAHTCVFMCFVWISEQTAIISLYSINWLVLIIERKCVYCAVRTGSLYIIQANFFFTRLIKNFLMNRRLGGPQ